MSEYIFKLPDLGEGTVESEIAEWMVKIGDPVREGDPLCAMLTDKAAVELFAPVGGTVVSLAGEAGEIVPVGAPLVVFETGSQGLSEETGESAAPDRPVATAVTAPNADEEAEQASDRNEAKVLTSPSIRQRARETGVDLRQVPGSGPRGRILKTDFEQWLSKQRRDEALAVPSGRKKTGTTEIKVIGLRRKIAERLARSAREIPHFTYVEEVDVTALESLREHLNSRKTRDESKLTPLAFIGMALVRVLKDFPQCNAHYDSERNVIVRRQAVHLGIATQTADGLKVPVARHCEARSLENLAAEFRRVSAAARDNSATREELTGSTITITSLGKLGGIVSTPVINQPEVAIIGVNKAVSRPVVLDGKIVVRTLMNLSSSFDHRFVDGYDAAAMIQSLRELLEQPAMIFMTE